MNFLTNNKEESDVSELSSVPDEVDQLSDDLPLGATKCLNKKFAEPSSVRANFTRMKLDWVATKNQSFQGRSTGTNVSTLMARLDNQSMHHETATKRPHKPN